MSASLGWPGPFEFCWLSTCAWCVRASTLPRFRQKLAFFVHASRKQHLASWILDPRVQNPGLASQIGNEKDPLFVLLRANGYIAQFIDRMSSPNVFVCSYAHTLCHWKKRKKIETEAKITLSVLLILHGRGARWLGEELLLEGRWKGKV